MELREGDGGTGAVDSRCLSIAETGGVVPGRWQAGLGHEVALRKGTKRRAPGRRITLQLCGAAIGQEPIEARRVDPVAGGRSEAYGLDRRHRSRHGDTDLKTELSALEARRIALAAQGFDATSRGGAVGAARIRSAIGRLGLLQIDSVNVLARAHYLPLFSRLGPYDRDLLDAVSVARPKRFFEYWGHEASLLPVDLQPLLRWRMARALRGQGVWQRLEPFAGEKRAEADALLARIEREGPLAASDVAGGRATKGMWEWSDAKHALEWLFWSGQVASTHRRSSFERVYDLPERVLPRAVLEIPTPTGVDARRALLARSAKALGIATAHDLRDYYRIPPADAVPAIEQLIEDGTLVPVHVRGWRHQAYLHRDAKPGRRLGASALLSPFDPLVWHRPRTERLFGFRYRLEIYTPAHKREHGYYVLPFLMDGALVARVDLKADRKVGALVVQRAHVEPGAPADTAERLLGELRLTASWLGLPSLVVSPVAAHPGLEDVRDIEAHSSAAGSPVSTIRSDLIASA